MLSDYTVAELRAEIARREKKGIPHVPNRFCDFCQNFIAWNGKGDVPKTYNPCALKHKMKFYNGEPWEDFGFYRNNCKDWIPETPPDNQ